MLGSAFSEGSPFTSHHSFGFDAPSGSHSSGSGSNTSSASNLGKGLVRSKKQRPPSRLSSLDEIHLAAERQMQRVVANSPLLTENSSPQTSSQLSNAASNQTILTSHKSSQEESSKPQVVAESPPMLSSSLSPNNPGGGHRKPTAVKPAPVVCHYKGRGTVLCCILTNTFLLQTIDKRKSVPVKRQQPSVTAAIPGKDSTPSAPARKRTRLNFTSDEASKSPTKALTESSNSRSNLGKSSKKKPAIENNRKIDHFFSAVKKHATESADKDKQPKAINSDSELETLRARCEELEKTCKDMNDQLKAVSNNQTIMNTALKASLCQREKQLEELRKSSEKDDARSARIIEKLIRVDGAREAKELRQKLASDGARLGRITYTRAGMRTVETWEEGHASKLLQRRQSDLESKKQILLGRQNIVEQAAKALSEGKEITEAIGGLVLNNSLAIVDAQESVRLHLDGIQKQESELKQEEQSLKKEKSEHIRALKRVASEDASRFRSRPKVRYIHRLQSPNSLLSNLSFSF